MNKDILFEIKKTLSNRPYFILMFLIISIPVVLINLKNRNQDFCNGQTIKFCYSINNTGQVSQVFILKKKSDIKFYNELNEIQNIKSEDYLPISPFSFYLVPIDTKACILKELSDSICKIKFEYNKHSVTHIINGYIISDFLHNDKANN